MVCDVPHCLLIVFRRLIYLLYLTPYVFWRHSHLTPCSKNADHHRLLSNIPKTLLKIYKDKTVLDFQLERLSKVLDLKDVIIVVGFKKEMIMKSCPELNYVVN